MRERTRIINLIKAALTRLETLRTPENLPIPANTRDEMRRDLARLALVRDRIAAIEQARLARLQQAPAAGPHAMVQLLARVIGVGIETADMLVQEVLSRKLRDGLWRAMPASPVRPTRAAPGGGKTDWPSRQSAGVPRPNPVGVAVPPVPKGQRARAVVSGAVSSAFIHA